VSVSLPTWSANVGYEEGEAWVLSRMITGYPRFFIHKSIAALARDVTEKYGCSGEEAILFPSSSAARRCVDFVRANATDATAPELLRDLRILPLVLDPYKSRVDLPQAATPTIWAVMCAAELFPVAKQYWQHTGDFVSSRRAEFYHNLLKDGLLVPESSLEPLPDAPTTKEKPCRGPRRYRRQISIDTDDAAPASSPQRYGADESARFLEERFGRNLDLSLLDRARSAIKRRIAGAVVLDGESSPAAGILDGDSHSALNDNTRGVAELSEDDIYLFPCGMNAIFNAHRFLLRARGALPSVNYGFPYVDTLKILQKFGPGCIFYGRASEADLTDLEARLAQGERILAFFCEFPGNPLLTCPSLDRIRRLADTYDFAIVVDETIGTFANINVLPFADIVVSSLTKIFSGESNVMGGSAIINPRSRYYASLKDAALHEFEDTYWPEDVVFLERNSRDFASRVDRVNANAEAIYQALKANPLVKHIYYPRSPDTIANYEKCRIPGGGYGGLLSVVFHDKRHAMAFYDAIDTAKGPSLGTNFTLVSPYVLLAHYNELSWAASLGVDPDLIRISVGLEDTKHLASVFQAALASAEKA